jgi:GNAT superfamily N-acetyltransferase
MTPPAMARAEVAPRGRVVVRNWTEADIPALVEAHQRVYPDYPDEDGHYEPRHYAMQLAAFPEGQFLAEIDGVIVGYATSIIVQLDNMPDDYRYNEITGSGTFSTHNPAGDTLYGADIGVVPGQRGKGVSKRLYAARKKLMQRHNLRRMVAYGRIPGYKDHAGTWTPDEYVEKVK